MIGDCVYLVRYGPTLTQSPPLGPMNLSSVLKSNGYHSRLRQPPEDIRLEMTDEKLLDLEVSSNCYQVGFGFESGSEECLRRVDRRSSSRPSFLRRFLCWFYIRFYFRPRQIRVLFSEVRHSGFLGVARVGWSYPKTRPA